MSTKDSPLPEESRRSGELADEAYLRLGEIANGLKVCLNQGRVPDLTPYIERNPDLAENIRDLLDTLLLLQLARGGPP